MPTTPASYTHQRARTHDARTHTTTPNTLPAYGLPSGSSPAYGLPSGSQSSLRAPVRLQSSLRAPNKITPTGSRPAPVKPTGSQQHYPYGLPSGSQSSLRAPNKITPTGSRPAPVNAGGRRLTITKTTTTFPAFQRGSNIQRGLQRRWPSSYYHKDDNHLSGITTWF